MGAFREQLTARWSEVPGALPGEGAFSPGPALWVGKREIAHFDGEDIVDVRLTKELIRERRARLKADVRITLRANSSDWIEFRGSTDDDVADLLALINDAVEANEPTATPGLPPTGTDLARRRRFH